MKGELYTGSEEMLEAVNVAYEYIRSLGGVQTYERRLKMPFGEDQTGLVDATAHLPGHLHIIEYKHGEGIPVRAEGNLQSICYALSVLASGLVEEWITITIVQPRCGDYPIKSWTIPIDELLAFLPMLEEAVAKSEEAIALMQCGLSIEHLLNPGKEQCRWCRAAEAGTCPALQNLALRSAQADFSGVTRLDEIRTIHLPEPTDIPVDRMGELLQAAPLLIHWFGQVHKYAEEAALSGAEIPGQKLVRPAARRRWHGEDALLATRLSDITGGQIPREKFFRWGLITITDATALLKRWGKSRTESQEAITESMAFLTLRSSQGPLQMAPLSDDRPAVQPAADFKGVDVSALIDGPK